VSLSGSIDWFCYPHFDSPSLFCALLDDEKGGHFKITPETDDFTNKQFYWPETNVLITRFLTPGGVGEIKDFMSLQNPHDKHNVHNHQRLYRIVRQVRGTLSFSMECFPAFNFARDTASCELTEHGAVFHSSSQNLYLSAGTRLEMHQRGCTARFSLSEGETVMFFLQQECSACIAAQPHLNEADDEFHATISFWRNWISQCSYTGRWREMVHRSALTLKLLTFEPTGAIVAAPTCSLPEMIGGGRNWDYRYTWLRDAAFTLYGLLRIGFTGEADKFMGWLEARCHELNPDGSLQVMYGIRGEHVLEEQILSHLKGYRNSSPVRVGNGAYNQLQLDVYGELMDSIYLYNKYGSPISYDLWKHLRKLVDWVCQNWNIPDEGVWEVRGGRKHFVYSKIMCWVAVDRGLRLADKRSFPTDRARWLKVRDEIYEEIMRSGWCEERGAFVQHFGSTTLDAATLIMPLVFFISPTDPRMLSTLDAILQPPLKGGLVSDGLVYRYNIDQSLDGLDGAEGTFNICSFWLVEALTRAGRVDRSRLEQARLMFEQMLGYANHVGLFAEETGPSGKALGNFPQAFTHLALISAAYNLDRALDRK
jgi:GH15 family glucan-1,4-alpha-glucosidase